MSRSHLQDFVMIKRELGHAHTETQADDASDERFQPERYFATSVDAPVSRFTATPAAD
jgi:hypothetical protein